MHLILHLPVIVHFSQPYSRTKRHVISFYKEAQFKVQFKNYQYELTKRVNEKASLVSFLAI